MKEGAKGLEQAWNQGRVNPIHVTWLNGPDVERIALRDDERFTASNRFAQTDE